jgi:hypothetical protein
MTTEVFDEERKRLERKETRMGARTISGMF